jgi:hypothetical protein
MTMACARSLRSAVEPVCGVGAYAWRMEPDRSVLPDWMTLGHRPV